MRPERLTKKQAQTAWDAIERDITLHPWQGERIKLPHIDMEKIFAGRKSMTWRACLRAVRSILDNLQMT